MHCPYCESPAFETSSECLVCGLSLKKCDNLFGAVPRLGEIVSDLSKVLKASRQRQILATFRNIRRRLPQIHLSVVTINLNIAVDPGVYAFWLFNRGGLCQDLEKGGQNHDILLLIDTENKRAGFILGYGLEPFIGQRHLEASLARARDDFSNARFADGIRTAFLTLADELERASSSIEETFGVKLDMIYQEDDQSTRENQVAG